MRTVGLLAIAAVVAVLLVLLPDRVSPRATKELRPDPPPAPEKAPLAPPSVDTLRAQSCLARYEAAQAFIRAGPAAVEPLVTLIATTSLQPDEPPFAFDGWYERAAAEYALRRLAPAARAELEALLGDPGRKLVVARFLAEIGVLEPLLSLVEEHCLEAVPTLGKVGAARELAQVWHRSPYMVSRELIAMGPEAAPALDLLLELFREPSDELLRVFQAMGECAREALPAITAHLQSGRLKPSRRVSDTLVALGGSGEWVERGYLAALRNRKSLEPEQARRLRAELGSRTDEMVELLFAELMRDYRRYPWPAIYAISTLGEAAVPRLRVLVGGEDEKLRWLALRALADMGPAGAGAGARLAAERSLSDPDPDVRRDALWCFVKLHDDRDRAVALIRPLLSDPDPDVRVHAAIQYHEVTGDADAVLPVLEECLSGDIDGMEIMQMLAAKRLAHIGEPGWPLLETVLRDGDRFVRKYALDGLAGQNGLPAPVLEQVRVCLRSSNADPRVAAAAVLYDHGLPASEYFDVLVEAMLPKKTGYRWNYTAPRVAALKLVERMGDEATPAMPMVESLRVSPFPGVREVARAAQR